MVVGKSIVPVNSQISLPNQIESVHSMLSSIRPELQATRLVQRVIALLPVDPSSACQRLLNSAIKDLKNKIVIAGLDLAAEAAKIHKLPPILKHEDVLESYSTTNTLDLAYKMGLLSRPEWRRLVRAYDIRKDLEHEDDQYEAQFEDCIYVFSTCIEIVLSKDPIELIRISDVKDLIESSEKCSFTPDLLEDYKKAPDVRQTEIVKMLIGIARSSKQPDIIRQNAVEALRGLEPLTLEKVKISMAADLHDSLKGQPYKEVDMKIAAAIGFIPYLKQRRVSAFFQELTDGLLSISHHWQDYSFHRESLSQFEEYGGLSVLPEQQLRSIILWLVKCYLGERGGYGPRGRNRSVFYSDAAVPIITRLFSGRDERVGVIFRQIVDEDTYIRDVCSYPPIARRLEILRDLVEDGK